MSWRVPVANESRNILGSQTLGNKDDSAGHNSVIGWLKSLVNTGMVAGQPWFVDSVSGLATYDGKAWTQAKATIATAVALASAGDTIFLQGSFSEAVTCSLAGLSFRGIGTGPQATQWTGAADAVCLTLAAERCLVENIKFRPPAYTAGTPAAIVLSNAGYSIIKGNRFQGKTGSYFGVYSPVCNSDNVQILDNEFIYLNNVTTVNGSAIVGVEAGGLSYSAWKIKGNSFDSCVVAVNINGRVCHVIGNYFSGLTGITAAGAVGNVCTTKLDLSGTSSGGNRVFGNHFGLTYSHAGGYQEAATGDDWAGNYIVGGLTTGVPS
jgi:hypothetical protein